MVFAEAVRLVFMALDEEPNRIQREAQMHICTDCGEPAVIYDNGTPLSCVVPTPGMKSNGRKQSRKVRPILGRSVPRANY